MHRRFLKERDAFPKSVDEYSQQVEQLLQHRRAGMDAAWEELEKGWDANSERAVTLKVRPRTNEEGVIRLNVGGSNVTVPWHLLAEAGGFKHSILGALLEGVWGEGRIPRDADGRVVLDESPACIKHIIHTMLGRSSSEALELPENAARLAVAADETPCHIYTAHVMGLPGCMPSHPKYGGSTILEPFEITPLGAKVREWVGGSAAHMTLIYRATRDGFGGEAFTARCTKDSPKTVSLIRVSSGQGDGDEDSVVGGYAVYPWDSAVGSKQLIAEEMFVFMLKDGSATRKRRLSKPIKWKPNPLYLKHVLKVPRTGGPYFGGGDLATIVDETSGSCTIQTKRNQYHFQIDPSSPFLALNGRKVVDIEVYRCSTTAPPSTTAPSTTTPGGDALKYTEAHDIDSFGRSIATSLMEERVVLDRAVKEMEAAGARVSAAVGALETVYGPSVAAGEQDTVVELNVRGTRMTTLRSTLLACQHSALATMFNEERWPATDKDEDEHGRRLIDCNPTCFSKILDVLRMRKRASWRWDAAGGAQEEGEEVEGEEEEEEEEEEEWEGEGEREGEEGEEEEEEGNGGLPVGVSIKQADVEAFCEAVNMYFPGCESFITDLVHPV